MTIVALLALILTHAHAQVEATAPRGVKGPIPKERLTKLLQSGTVDGYVVDGEDLRAAIAELGEGEDALLSHCIIEDGLRFEGTVRVRLDITDCEVRAAPKFIRGLWAGAALYAREVAFAENVTFSDTRFDGRVELIGAQFEGKASFAGSKLAEEADFTNAGFAGDAYFRGAVFKGARFDGAVFESEANFDGTIFLDSIGLEGTEFKGTALFRRATFEGEQRIHAIFHQRADFREAEFAGDAVFSPDTQGPGANFRGEVDFSGSAFGAQADFGGVAFPAPVTFRGRIFEGDAHFAGAHFDASASFDEGEFKKDADFTGAVFEGDANFSAAIFGGRADFERVEFVTDTVFKGAEFQGPGIFIYARFEGPSYFNVSEFKARAEFFDSVMRGEVTFAEAVIAGRASFLRVAFGERADFTKVQFFDDAYLADAVFSGDALFRDVRFEGDAVFSGAALRGLFDFQNVRAVGTLDLTNTSYDAYADFRDAHIRRINANSAERPAIVAARFDMRGARLGEAHFEDVIFEDDVDFSDAAFGVTAQGAGMKNTVFRFVTFEADASFGRTRFSGRLALENVKFQSRADFTDADLSGITRGSPPSFSLSYVTFNDLRVEWTQLPRPGLWAQQGEQRITTAIDPPRDDEESPEPLEPLSRVFERLEAGFRDQGQLADANAANYHRKRTELLEARAEGLTWRRLWLEAQWIFWGATAGYGTKLWWIVGWAALIDLVFTLIYWLGAGIHREPHPETQREHSVHLRLLDLPKHYLKEKSGRMIRSKLVDALRVSSVVLFKVGYRDTTLSGTVAGIQVHHLVRIEWAVGFYVLAVLTVTLANTQPLLNRLITGIF